MPNTAFKCENPDLTRKPVGVCTEFMSGGAAAKRDTAHLDDRINAQSEWFNSRFALLCRMPGLVIPVNVLPYPGTC